MKDLEGSSACPCGDKLTFKLKKPTPLTPTISAVKCKGCESAYLVKATVDLQRRVDVSVAIQHLSPKCEEVIQRGIDARARHEQDDKGRADGDGSVPQSGKDQAKYSHH